MDSRFELNPDVMTVDKVSGVRAERVPKRKIAAGKKFPPSLSAEGGVYTVKPGDQLLKVLMRDFGLSRREVRPLLELIRKHNNLDDIELIKVGQKIIIPPLSRLPDASFVHARTIASPAQAVAAVRDVNHSFKLDSPIPPLADTEIITRLKDSWGKIVPSKAEMHKPLLLETPTFSLTLDPNNYPVFARMDGARIILDQNSSIPPLVKALIEDKDPKVRIVPQSTPGTRGLLSSLLDEGGFYSVEENFSMEFGVDPKLTVKADFKVEKSAESLIRQDVALINSGMVMLPEIVGDFLKKAGFSLHQPFASHKSAAHSDSRGVNHVSSKKQGEMTDSILSALSVSYENNRLLDLFANDKNGIFLTVKAERYFERNGQRFVVTSFDGDPVNYTLFRILETKGFNVVMLDAKDDFRAVSEKLVSRMKIKGRYANHQILDDKYAGYSLTMSGFKLDDPLLPGGGIFLTDRNMDKIVRDLMQDNGFVINSR